MKPIQFKKSLPFNYDSPQTMYEDNKQKKITGLMAYQSKIISKFMDTYTSDKQQDIALELPTGSGKTLVGLVIAEYIRRKYCKKVVYVCLNNQLVNQVVLEANEKYNIKAVALTGSQSEYKPTSTLAYMQAKAVAITNYSSIFNNHSYFSDSNIFYIYDDVHSASSYISNNWSVRITKDDSLFYSLIDVLKSSIGENAYQHLMNNSDNLADPMWVDMVPTTFVNKKSKEITDLLNSLSECSKGHNTFAWKNICNNLSACNIFMSEKEILIRPQISPCKTVNSFLNASTRVYMSATLGRSGELEKTFGVEDISEIILSGDDKPKIGRHLFLFPDLLFKKENKKSELFKQLQIPFNRSVALVNSTPEEKKLTESIHESLPKINVFTGRDLENKMSTFEQSSSSVAILANRYDGVSFPDDCSHLELIKDLKIYENLQDRFFSSRLKASPVIEEQQIIRIIQAIGRCTRSANDYSTIIIEGNDIQSILLSEKKQRLFEPELRAELCTGIETSSSQDTLTELSEVGQLVLNQHDPNWENIEDHILEMRDNFNNEERECSIHDLLKSVVPLEVKFQYALWNDDEYAAVQISTAIVDKLAKKGDKRLKGFLYYWKYLNFSIRLKQSSSKSETESIKNDFIAFINTESHSISWFPRLSRLLSIDSPQIKNSQQNDERIAIQTDNIEKILNNELSNKTKTSRMKLFSSQKKQILDTLSNKGGTDYEKAVTKLGYWLGFKTDNTSSSGGPDPWWFIDGHTLIVSEIKILGENNPISKDHISEFNGHKDWLINSSDYPNIDNTTNFTCVFISNSKKIDRDAQNIILRDSLYLNSNDLLRFAQSALSTVASIYEEYDGPGDMLWTASAHNTISESCFSPKKILDSLNRRLIDLQNSND